MYHIIVFLIVVTNSIVDGENLWKEFKLPPAPPMPPMPLPKFPRDPDIRLLLGLNTSNRVNISEIYFLRMNDVEEAKLFHDAKWCTLKSISLNLSIAVKLNDCPVEVRRDCNASIVLVVGSNTDNVFWKQNKSSSIIDPRCREVLTGSDDDGGDTDDCYEDIIEPRMMLYQQILDGTHVCYTNFEVSIRHTIWIGIVMGLVIIVVIVVYIIFHNKRNQNNHQENDTNNDGNRETDFMNTTNL